MVDMRKLAHELTLEGNRPDRAISFDVQPLPSEVEVLKITIEDLEELPIFLSVSEQQILCIVYLFQDKEVDPAKINDMNIRMLSTNIAVPLSSFAKVDNQYVLYGALATTSSMNEIIHEIEVLSSNAISAIETMSDYLKAA